MGKNCVFLSHVFLRFVSTLTFWMYNLSPGKILCKLKVPLRTVKTSACKQCSRNTSRFRIAASVICLSFSTIRLMLPNTLYQSVLHKVWPSRYRWKPSFVYLEKKTKMKTKQMKRLSRRCTWGICRPWPSGVRLSSMELSVLLYPSCIVAPACSSVRVSIRMVRNYSRLAWYLSAVPG